MRDVLTGCIVAFSMYSKIPVPHVDWTEKNMKYAMCYFPLIGLVEGAVVYLWYYLAVYLGLTGTLRGAVMMVIPLAVSGGIHMDGFLDTSDALSSWKDREAKLEILKDSHCGAFAIICGTVYMILSYGVNTEAGTPDLPVLLFVFMLSRAWSGLGVVMLRKAKDSGLLRAFADAAAKRRTAIVMVIYILLGSIAMVCMDYRRGGVAAVLMILTFLYYREMSYKKFGGITGDLAGWFVQTAELVVWMGVVLL